MYIRPKDRSYKYSPVYRAITSGNDSNKPDSICNGESLACPGDKPAPACANVHSGRGVCVETDRGSQNSNRVTGPAHINPSQQGATLLGPCTTHNLQKTTPLPTLPQKQYFILYQ